MNSFIKIIRSIFYSLLFISIAGESCEVMGGSLNRTALGDPQVAESDNPREALKKSVYASQNVKSYRVRMQVTWTGYDDKVINETSITEVVSPDRSHDIKRNGEEIIIGKKMYSKQGDGPWEASTMDISMFPSPQTGGKIREIERIEKAENVKLIGRDTVDGISTLVYQYSRTSSDKSRSNTTKTWIAETDGLIRRMEYAIEEGSKKLTILCTFYDYNADIKIEPPDVSALAPPSPSPGSGGGIGSGSGTGVGPGHGYNMGGVGRNAVATTVDQRPVPLNAPKLGYTEEARKNKIQGTVTARVLVGADGMVKDVRIMRGLPDGLDEEAIRAAYQMRFRPAMKGGQPVASWYVVQMEFNLR